MPFGPAYQIERQQIEVRYAGASGPGLAVHASYRLINTGNRELSALEMILPDAKAYGRRNLRVLLDGGELAPSSDPGSGENKLRIPFGRALAQKQKLELSIAYELNSVSSEQTEITVADDAFSLRPGWHPVLLAPKGAFAKGGEPPKKWDLSVRVPEGFLVHSSGRARSTRKANGEVTHHFELTSRHFDPFVAAGRYHEQKVRTRDGTVIFWTRQSLPDAQVSQAGEQIAAAVKVYETSFGPRDGKARPVWIIECASEGLPTRARDREGAVGCFSLPEVAQFARSSFQAGVADKRFVRLVERELARTWFGYLVSLRLDQEPLPMDAAADYAATFAAAEGAGKAARREYVAALLERYDRAVRQGPEKTVLSIRLTDPAWQVEAGCDRSELFFFALEDHYGDATVRQALAHLVRSLRGKQAGSEDLRAALEELTGQRLGDFFRAWLNRPEIPADFRARYEAKIEGRE
ncbi:MAG TPA: hypothetical protein VHM88_08030 [Candidatus Acidoferrales bacterium]|nr:hypothetical protein [Candidatus Acidoferrales bacterium]